MSRRKKADRRRIYPDPRYSSTLLTQFMNVVISKGKKSVAENIVYTALKEFKKKVGGEDDELTLFKAALNNVKPTLEVKSRRVGGANYQVPIEVAPARRTAFRRADGVRRGHRFRIVLGRRARGHRPHRCPGLDVRAHRRSGRLCPVQGASRAPPDRGHRARRRRHRDPGGARRMTPPRSPGPDRS